MCHKAEKHHAIASARLLSARAKNADITATISTCLFSAASYYRRNVINTHGSRVSRKPLVASISDNIYLRSRELSDAVTQMVCRGRRDARAIMSAQRLHYTGSMLIFCYRPSTTSSKESHQQASVRTRLSNVLPPHGSEGSSAGCPIIVEGGESHEQVNTNDTTASQPEENFEVQYRCSGAGHPFPLPVSLRVQILISIHHQTPRIHGLWYIHYGDVVITVCLSLCGSKVFIFHCLFSENYVTTTSATSYHFWAHQSMKTECLSSWSNSLARRHLRLVL